MSSHYKSTDEAPFVPDERSVPVVELSTLEHSDSGAGDPPEFCQGAYELDPDVIHQPMDGAMILVHLRSNRIYELTRTASRFCELLFEGRPSDACIQSLQQEFEAPAEMIRNEAQSLLRELQLEEIVRPAS